MVEIISVRFKSGGKQYYFNPNGIQFQLGDGVIVETSKGVEFGECVQANSMVDEMELIAPLRPVLRAATEEDVLTVEKNKEKEAKAFAVCQEKIAEHGLDMKLVEVECNFEGNKITFFFTSDGRVDFRELVKDLAGVFRSRIELRQIGVRDEAKMLGGLGICGRPFCCNQFLTEFYPVSTKMAKVQNMSLNPKKISGCCGRLMCCLRYEQEAYEDLVKTVPKNGAFVETPDGYGNVTQVNLLRQTVKVKLDGDNEPKQFTAKQVASVPGGRPKDGEKPAHVLEYVPEEEVVADEPVDEWSIPMLEDYADMDKHRERREKLAAAERAEQDARDAYERQRGGRNRRGRGNNRGRGGKPAGEKAEEQVKQDKPKQAKPAEQPKTEGGDKNRRNRNRKPKQGGEKPAEQPKQDKPVKQEKPAADKPKTEGGEKKKSGNNRRRNYRPKGDKKPNGNE